MNNLVSVIVPIYKVEPYLRQCIDSIINQTYKNLEIILVDDGSPDGCPQICDEYVSKDTRIKVIHKENGGLSSARNAGLDIATGEYVAFVDSDDWIEPTMYEDLLGVMKTHQSDIVVCKYRNYFDGCDMSESGNNTVCSFEGYFNFIDNLIPPGSPILYFMVWNKLYKRDVIKNVRFKDKQIYEDLYFDRLIFRNCKKVTYLDKTYYNYQIDRPGATASFFNDNKLAKISELEAYLVELKDSDQIDIYNKYLVFSAFSAMELYYSAMERNATEESKKTILSFFYKCYRLLPKSHTNLRLAIFNYFPNIYIYIKLHFR